MLCSQPLVKFINILQTNFSLFWQLFSSYVYVEKAAETTFVLKKCAKNVGEIDPSFVRRFKFVIWRMNMELRNFFEKLE